MRGPTRQEPKSCLWPSLGFCTIIFLIPLPCNLRNSAGMRIWEISWEAYYHAFRLLQNTIIKSLQKLFDLMSRRERQREGEREGHYSCLLEQNLKNEILKIMHIPLCFSHPSLFLQLKETGNGKNHHLMLITTLKAENWSVNN